MLVFGAEKKEVAVGESIETAMNSVKRFPDAYLFLKDGKPVPMTTVIIDGDVIEAVRIASGG